VILILGVRFHPFTPIKRNHPSSVINHRLKRWEGKISVIEEANQNLITRAAIFFTEPYIYDPSVDIVIVYDEGWCYCLGG
jgi:hypothetical protein